MLRNYLRTAIRNIIRNRVQSVIQVLSLVIGIAAMILIGLYARYESSDRSTRSVFAQLNYKPADQWKLVAGARLEQFLKFDSQGMIRYPGIDEQFGSLNKFNTDENVWFIPRFGVIWSPADHHIFKLMYGEANKPYSLENIANLEIESDVIIHLEPEEIETLEFNYLLSYSWFSFNLNLFINNIENLRTIRLVKNKEDELIKVMDNSGVMVNYGSELIFSAEPFKDIGLELSATYQEFDDRGDKGRNISHSPNLLLSAKMNYGWGPLTFGISGIYTDAMEPFTPDEDDEIKEIFNASDAYFITSCNLRYDHKPTGLYAALNISNVFDEEVRYPATDNAQFKYGLIDKGRICMATIGWKF